jgi:hypothetical protein
MKKYILSILIALVLIMTLAVPALAATDADVTVTATPSFIAIADNQSSYDFGVVASSSTPYTPTDWCAITNTSSVQTDITIAVTTSTWSGGVTWTHSDTSTPGEDTAGLKANRGGSWGTGDVIIKYDTPNYIYEDCPATTNFAYGLKLWAPTSFTDAVQKEITVRVSAAAG